MKIIFVSDCLDMQWLKYEDEAIYFYDDFTLPRANTRDLCKEECMAMSGGPCKSFDFKYNDGPCFLSSEDQHSQTLQKSNGYNYEENCDGKKH